MVLILAMQDICFFLYQARDFQSKSKSSVYALASRIACIVALGGFELGLDPRSLGPHCVLHLSFSTLQECHRHGNAVACTRPRRLDLRAVALCLSRQCRSHLMRTSNARDWHLRRNVGLLSRLRGVSNSSGNLENLHRNRLCLCGQQVPQNSALCGGVAQRAQR